MSRYDDMCTRIYPEKQATDLNLQIIATEIAFVWCRKAMFATK
jgi:hypothetical protein